MKKGIFTLIMVSLAGLLFLVAGALTAADVPDEITISNEHYKSDKKGPVKLSHKKHTEDLKIACTDCHHDYQDGKNVWKEGDPVKKCDACHSPLKKEGGALKLNVAYHKNCKGCHKKAAADGKEAPYKKCSGCHEKK